jgi:hypothetical protein
MSVDLGAWSRRLLSAASPLPRPLYAVAMVLRAVFMLTLLAVIVRVSLPQSESIWSAYETPGDLVRLLIGLCAAGWIAMQLFKLPKDSGAARTWLCLGVAAVPFALIFAYAVW